MKVRKLLVPVARRIPKTRCARNIKAIFLVQQIIKHPCNEKSSKTNLMADYMLLPMHELNEVHIEEPLIASIDI
jgi:hypothetical protein